MNRQPTSRPPFDLLTIARVVPIRLVPSQWPDRDLADPNRLDPRLPVFCEEPDGRWLRWAA